MTDANVHTTETGSSIAVRTQVDGKPLVTVHQGMSIADCPTSLDLTTRKGKALALKAMSPSDVDFGPDGGVRVKVTDWLIFPDQRIDTETGEVSEFTRIALFTNDGRVFRTSAAHGPKRMKAMLELFPRSEWQAGLEVEIRQRVSPKTQRIYHDITVVCEDEPQAE